MNILITYFSGTGNTSFVASRLAGRLRAAKPDEGVPAASGHAVSCMPIERVADRELTAADLVVLGFPIYACDAPTPVYEFVRRKATASRTPADPARPIPV
ncbi:MAG: flavodoxin domain-containing protein, partial [Spirochaetales bacterium]|nr:flavodoxin domain-containing protein [Spirochaetales bacterium]